MFKSKGWILTAGLILGAAGMVLGGLGMPSIETPSAQLPQTEAKIQTVQMQLIKEASPELYAFQDRLQKIAVQIGKITKSFAQKKIDKDTARAKLLPLMEEEREIQNNPYFLVEQWLMQVYVSSPESSKKVK